MTGSASVAAATPKMRPYAGIGVIIFNVRSRNLPLQLYDEPGLLRVGVLKRPELTVNEWIFGLPDGTASLIVSARKDNWVRVCYDAAGREGWIDPMYKGRFLPWDQYLRMHTGHMLSGLKSKYYKLQKHRGGDPAATLTPKQVFKMLKIEHAWALVLTDQEMIGWVRWRDEDGRLLVGIEP